MKKEDLIYSFQAIDDEMIEQVDNLRRQRQRNKNIWMKWTVAAACLCLVLIGMVAFRGNEFLDKGKLTTPITVYAAEAGNEDNMVELTDKSAIIAEYNMTSSSTPALTFDIDYPRNGVTYRLNVSGGGKLVKYDISDEGIWSVIANGTELEYNKEEHIYWIPSGKLESKAEIEIEIIEDEEVIEQLKVIIEENQEGMGYVARITG